MKLVHICQMYCPQKKRSLILLFFKFFETSTFLCLIQWHVFTFYLCVNVSLLTSKFYFSTQGLLGSVFCWSCATHMIWISPRKQTKNVDKRAKNRIKLKWRAVWKDVGAFLVKNFESYVGQLILEEGKLRKIVCCKSVSLLSLLKYIETSIRPVFFKKRIIP